MARIESIDSLKWFAMLLVVVGHFIDMGVAYSDNYRAMFVFIYAFHMPLFIFLSGLFDHARDKFPLDSVVFFVAWGIVLQVLYLFVGMALGRNASFSLFATSGLPWFMFAMAAWKSLCWILSGRSAVAVFAIAVSLGLAIRYDTINFDLFEIGRIVIFFPFYWAGFSLTPEKVLRVLRRRACVVVSACSVLAFLLACFVFTDSVYAYRTVFTAHSAYASVPIKNCGWPHQLLAYGVAAMLCASFISIFSMLRLKVLARWGQRTLAAYSWHYPVVYALQAAGIPASLLNGAVSGGGYIWVSLAVLTTVVLSFEMFQKPIDALRLMLKRKAINPQST
ncbi:acyltransferase family protein [Rubneribacter sp.]